MKKIFVLTIYVLLMVLIGVGNAHANRPKPKTFGTTKALPEISFMTREDFTSKTRFVRNKSPNDSYLGYELRVPSDWKETKIDSTGLLLTSKLLNTLVEYESPLGVYNKKSKLDIQAIELDTAVTPERWLLEHMLALGYHIEHMGIHSPTRAEALIAYIEKGQSYIERSIVEINGKRALLMTYKMPAEAWTEQHVLQAQVMDSFKLLTEFEGEIENYKTFNFLNFAELRYPRDWHLRDPGIESIDHMKVNILNVPNLNTHLRNFNEIDGRIQVSMVSIYGTETLDAELSRQKEEFEKFSFDYQPENKVDIPSAFFIQPAFEFADISAFKTFEDPFARKKISEKELWMGVLAAGDFYYFVKMLTPSRKSDYYIWLRNTEVFKIVLEGLRPNTRASVLQ